MAGGAPEFRRFEHSADEGIYGEVCEGNKEPLLRRDVGARRESPLVSDPKLSHAAHQERVEGQGRPRVHVPLGGAGLADDEKLRGRRAREDAGRGIRGSD